MKHRRRRGGCIVRLLLAAVALALLAAGGVAWSLSTPFEGFADSAVVDIEKGTGTRAIASELARAGVLRFFWQFLAVRLLRPSAKLQAGEYRFSQPDSAWHVFDRIVRGDVFYYELTIPEGSNVFDIAAEVDRLGFLSGSDFLQAAHNPASIRDLAPAAPTLEGYLFPSTYQVTRHTGIHQLCRMMTDEFRRQWRLLDPPAGVEVSRVVTLASIVEKETAVAGERPEVASVYYNRLNLGMALDCDPTTIYAALLDRRYRGVIHRSDLASANTYNTYTHVGLPPGPIANPGVASLRAALHPADTNYLYFVAKPDGSGGHQFSVDLAAHNRAVEQYRRRSRNRTVGGEIGQRRGR
ncbi:MAG: endolytic transglycosylase MltG [Bryobacteraceae bacterium]|jgi:UPF0755 protein